jgi:hypothetical protein
MTNKTAKRISEHVVELRFAPNPKVLDHRGIWAEKLAAELGLPEWRIAENRIDLSESSHKRTVFVAFMNAGFTTFDADTVDYFADQATKAMRALMKLDGFENPLAIERFGVRSRFLTSVDFSFADLRARYVAKFLTPRDNVERIMNAELVDIGGPLNFKDSKGRFFNTMSGPMTEEQGKLFFPQREGVPPVGLYFDHDYWTRPTSPLRENDVALMLKEFALSGWERHELVLKLLCE